MVDINIEQIQQSVSKAKASYGGSLANSAAMVAAFHPFTYVKVLIQFGHEPLPSYQSRNFFGKEVCYYPSIYQYFGHIKKVDGWLGLFRGLGPRMVHELVNKTVTNIVSQKLKEEAEEDADSVDPKSVYSFVKETTNLAVAKTAGCVLSYPFQVISVRMMVQFIGRETHYSNIFSSIKEIYQEEGIGGFFRGLIPCLLHELVGLCIIRVLNYIVANYLVSQLSEELSEVEEVKVSLYQISNYLSSSVTYPFQLVSNIMAVNDTNLEAGNPPLFPIYSSWKECWTELGKQGLKQRGSSILFWRTVPEIL